MWAGCPSVPLSIEHNFHINRTIAKYETTAIRRTKSQRVASRLLCARGCAFQKRIWNCHSIYYNIIWCIPFWNMRDGKKQKKKISAQWNKTKQKTIRALIKSFPFLRKMRSLANTKQISVLLWAMLYHHRSQNKNKEPPHLIHQQQREKINRIKTKGSKKWKEFVSSSL